MTTTIVYLGRNQENSIFTIMLLEFILQTKVSVLTLFYYDILETCEDIDISYDTLYVKLNN